MADYREKMVQNDTVWAVLTAYRPDASLAETVRILRGQFDGVVVVDDASGDASDRVLVAAKDAGAILVRHDENRGIGAALNTGTARARELGATLVATFDQDSRVPTGFRSDMVATLRHAEESGQRIGLVVPEFFAGVRQASAQVDGLLSARNVIQSGMLIDVRVLDELGGFREDFFIDLVDTEFELRARRAGLRTIAAPGVRLNHRLGAQYRRELFGRTVGLPPVLPTTITLSTPFRYYYRARNRAVLNRQFRGFETLPRLRATVVDNLHFVDATILARPRRALWRVLRAGRHAARAQLMGPIPTRVAELAATVRWAAPPVSDASAGGSGS